MELKNKILTELEEKRGGYVSGESLSEKFGVTRQAVWKVVKKLTAEGYIINSVTNKGYMLDGRCDLLSSSVISEKTGAHVECYDCVTSTNTVARQKYCEYGKCVIVADSQSEGRKKDGGRFLSPERKGIYMSVAVPLCYPLSCAEKLRGVCASTVAECIGRACKAKPEIKNTDELYIDGKKVCGILTEGEVNFAAATITGAVIGIGIYTAEVGGTLGYVSSCESRNALIADIYINLEKALLYA